MSADIELRRDHAIDGRNDQRTAAGLLPAAALNHRQEEWAADLMAWAGAADAAHGVALLLAETSFVPKSMQHRPGDVTGAILTAMELGVPVMWALSHIDIVEGAPAIRAKGLRSLMLRHGHEIWAEESTGTRAVVCARRKGSQRVERSVWTLDRAKKAELLGKKNWRLYPQDMLLNRATAEAVRLAAPDVLLGHYTVDELGGEESPNGPAPVADDKPAPAKRRTAQRAPKPEPGPAPDELPVDMPTPSSAPITAPFPAESLPSTCDLNMPHDSRFSPPHGCPAGRPTRVASIQPPADEPEDHLGGELPGTCDLTLPHDSRYQYGCPPNCPTRMAATRVPAARDETEAVDMLEAAGFQVETLDVIDTMQDEPVLPGEPERMVSDGQRKRMAVEMRRAGIVDRDQRLSFVSDIVGREIQSGNDLTMAEASRVIDAVVDLQTEAGLAAVEPTEGDQ